MMNAADYAAKSDAELMQFCTTSARTLTALSRRIASTVDAPELEAAFNNLTAHLEAALAELDSRHCAH